MKLFVQAQAHLLMGPIPQQYIAKRAVEFSRAISDRGAGMQNCLGFIDVELLVWPDLKDTCSSS